MTWANRKATLSKNTLNVMSLNHGTYNVVSCVDNDPLSELVMNLDCAKLDFMFTSKIYT